MEDLQLTIRMQGLDRVRGLIGRLTGTQMRDAYANALNDVGFRLRGAMQTTLGQRFDRVTPFIQRSPKVFPATLNHLTMAVAPTMDTRKTWQPGMKLGGKVGVDPQQVLQAQELGGPRRDKRSEVALRRAGILPNGYQTAIPATPFPGSDDGRGNLRGAFLAQLISYLQASSEQGYRANMGKRTMDRLRNQQDIGNLAARKVFKTTLGVRYFVSHGRLRGNSRTAHLAPGVWAARGIHDVDVRPVLMFVRKGKYKPRLQLDEVARAADVQDYLDSRMRYRVRQAAGL